MFKELSISGRGTIFKPILRWVYFGKTDAQAAQGFGMHQRVVARTLTSDFHQVENLKLAYPQHQKRA